MKEGVFWSSFTESTRLLKKLSLLKENNAHKRIPYSENCFEYSRSKDYRELYQKLVDNRDYDLLLKDDSMFQMSFSGGNVRLVFIQNPLEYESFEEFIESIGWDNEPVTIELLHEMFDDDYSQALEGMSLNVGATYLRYDVDSRGRIGNENIHAYTHLHIGLNNNIRIPVGRYMTPLAFTMFVIRHVYYDIWVDAVRRSQMTFDYKNKCDTLPAELWTELEKKDFYLC